MQGSYDCLVQGSNPAFFCWD